MPHLAFDCAPKIVGVGMTVHDGYSPVFISHLEGCERAVSGWRNAICPRVVGVSAASPRVAQGMSHLVEFADVDLSGVLFTSLIVVVRAWSPEVGTRDLLTLREEHSGCANVGPSPSRKRSPGPPFRHHPLKASCIEKLGMRGAQQVAKKAGHTSLAMISSNISRISSSSYTPEQRQHLRILCTPQHAIEHNDRHLPHWKCY